MNEIFEKFLKRRGKELPAQKQKLKASDIKTASQQKELLLKIARDLGYIE